MEIETAVKTLTQALRNDSSFYYAYQANIAMAFKDVFLLEIGYDNVDPVKLHEVANKAARNFIDLWANPTPEAEASVIPVDLSPTKMRYEKWDNCQVLDNELGVRLQVEDVCELLNKKA